MTRTLKCGEITQIGDPYVLRDRGKYYLYATSSPYGFKVWESPDLAAWQERGLALDAREEGNQWGVGDFWAPEVTYYLGNYYMIYSARDRDGSLKLALATATHPLGPFRNRKAPLFDRGKSFIDGHFFFDDDGKIYLYYVQDCSENIIDGKHISQIFVQEVSADLLTLLGEPVLAVEPSQPWEGIDRDWQWNEGPFVLKDRGVYYLMYSANCYASSDYAIGYAVADSPFGPWQKADGNPLLTKDLAAGFSGPGHNCVTRSPDGSLLLVYHTHTNPEKPSGDRKVNIDRLVIENGQLKVVRVMK